MWVWLTISMLLVIACIVFGIYSFISSRKLQKIISAELGLKSNKMQARDVGNGLSILQKQAMLNVETRLKSIEQNSLLTTHHMQEIQKKLTVLQSGTIVNKVDEEANWEDLGEDWEKLYYETRREKKILEDDLITVKNLLEESLNKIMELEKLQVDQAVNKSDAESSLNEINSLQNLMDDLQLKLEVGKERETELAQEVAYEKLMHNGYQLMQRENNRLHSEIDILENRFDEIIARNNLLEQKIKSLTELGSILEISEYEKMGIQNSVAQLLQKI